MIVYITIQSEPYEGYVITGVYSTLKKAEKHLKKDDEIIKWKLDGKEIVKKYPKGSGRTQLERNMPFLQSFTTEYLAKRLEAVEKGIKI